MVSDRSQEQKPPYVSFKTFALFLDDMTSGVPARIDRSYLTYNGKSGSTATQLLAALRFFDLVAGDGAPTQLMHQLAGTQGTRRTEFLHQLGLSAYSFVFQAMDPKTASYGQLTDAFKHKYHLADDVVRKCTKFFVSLAEAAQMPLSPKIISKRLRGSGSTKPNAKTNKNAKILMPTERQNSEMPNAIPVITPSASWCQLCIETTFPRFDLNWPSEQQLKWFGAFNELVKINPVDFGIRNNRDVVL